MKKMITLLLCYLLTSHSITYTMMMITGKSCQPSQELQKNQNEFKQKQSITTNHTSTSVNTCSTTLPTQKTTTTKQKLSNPSTSNTSALAKKQNNSKKLTQPTTTHNNHLHQQNDAIIEFRDPREKDLTLLSHPSLTVQLANSCHAIIQNPSQTIRAINNYDIQEIITDSFASIWLTCFLTAGSTATIQAMPFLTCILFGHCPDLAPTRRLSFEAALPIAFFWFVVMQKKLEAKIWSLKNKKTT